MDPEAFRLSLMSGISFSLLVVCAMWGVTTIQIVSYFRTFKTDPLYLKIAVGSLWVCETLFIVLKAATLYDLMFRSDPFLSIPLNMYVGGMFATIIQSIVQIIYAFRIYKVWAKIYIPLLCCTGSIYYFGASFAWYSVLIGQGVEKIIQLSQVYNWLVCSCYSVTAAVDVVITLSMCYLLRRNHDHIRKRTLRMLDKLVLWTIQTGTITSLMAVAVVGTYYRDTIRGNSAWLALSNVSTALYPLTMVALLNGRSFLRKIDGDGLVEVMSTLHFESEILSSTRPNIESSERSIISQSTQRPGPAV